MNQEQEYFKFWLGVKNKCDEIQKDYSNLSEINKIRVNNVRDSIFRANTISDVINILNNQMW